MAVLLTNGNGNYHEPHWMDQYVAPGLRLWMLLCLVGSVLLVMTVIVCCFMRIRIPRTKREIEMIAAKRRRRMQEREAGRQGSHGDAGGYDRGQTIVMNSMGKPHSGRSEHNRREPLNSHSVNV